MLYLQLLQFQFNLSLDNPTESSIRSFKHYNITTKYMVVEEIGWPYKNNYSFLQQVQDMLNNVQDNDRAIESAPTIHQSRSNIIPIVDQWPYIQDGNSLTNNILQDEIKDRHDAYAKLEKEYNDLAIDNQRLVRKSKRYKNKLSKARSRIDSQLKRPLQANDFKYPYSVDATDQTLLAIRKLL